MQADYKRDVQASMAAKGQGQPRQNCGSRMTVQGPQQIPKFQNIHVERFRFNLKQRGGKTIAGLQRQFKIADDNNSGTLNQYEFSKCIHDFGLSMDQKDIDSLFKAFDYDNSGEIEFNEFIRVVVGPMNNYRTNIVLKTFQSIDFNGDGALSLQDIKGRYNAKMHPDVRAGKKTEDEVLTEWLTTFEDHYNMVTGGANDGKITPEEFVEYYTHVSANIDNDAYFEVMMSNVWNTNNAQDQPFAGSSAKVTYVNSRDAYLRDHHRNLFGTDKQTPFNQRGKTDYTSNMKAVYNENDLKKVINVSAGGAQNSQGFDERQQRYL